MILLVHLILGALIGQKISNPYLAIILALLSHYFLDLIPHIDYPIKSADRNQWRKILLGGLKVLADLCTGILLVVMFSKNHPIIYLCAFVALIPDGLTVLKYSMPNNKIFEAHYKFHQKIHFLQNKKIPKFWRIFSQVAVVVICVILLKI